MNIDWVSDPYVPTALGLHFAPGMRQIPAIGTS